MPINDLHYLWEGCHGGRLLRSMKERLEKRDRSGSVHLQRTQVWFPAFHVGQLTSVHNSSSMGSDPFLVSSGTCTNVADTYTHK